MDGVVLWTPSILNLNFQHVLLTRWYPHVNSSFSSRFKTVYIVFQIRSELRGIQIPPPHSNLWVQISWKMKISKIYKNVFCD